MTFDRIDRRGFLAESGKATTAGWIALEIPWLAALASCRRDDANTANGFTALTGAEARAMRAFAARLIPSDQNLPGADEAGAVHFIDRAFGKPFFADVVPVVRAGLADLDARARALGERDFASVPPGRQEAIMRQVERTPFFLAARMLVVVGTFADSAYGGNRGEAGWKIVGFEHEPTYAAPFGWYDAHEEASAKAEG
ncbi:MAG TPA: gluconate 2-dehydrogenase subunit 3 family protein [Gemmatimonadaceae bacterium]|nr:gluconate 2-dehydrogenase subunit 3 family protein [Gemmatimonadaceae bacterium]